MRTIAKPIRTGCYVEFKKASSDEIVCAEVVDHYYTDKGHNFVLNIKGKGKHTTTGAFLYKNITLHKPGKLSRQEFKKITKRYQKALRKDERKRMKKRRPTRRF